MITLYFLECLLLNCSGIIIGLKANWYKLPFYSWKLAFTQFLWDLGNQIQEASHHSFLKVYAHCQKDHKLQSPLTALLYTLEPSSFQFLSWPSSKLLDRDVFVGAWVILCQRAESFLFRNHKTLCLLWVICWINAALFSFQTTSAIKVL